jgi:hypothetical protein
MRTAPPPVELALTPDNVLRATWTVNRSAKRFRNAAQRCYAKDAFEFATVNREKEEKLCDLKDAGIVWLHERKALHPAAIQGGLCVWRGGGFCFHSTLMPRGSGISPKTKGTCLYIEAKPKLADELRLADAIHLLEQLPKPSAEYERLDAP